MTTEVLWAIGICVGGFNVWGVFIINGLGRRIEILSTICNGLIPRNEVDKRVEDIYKYVSDRCDGEAEARHKLADSANALLITHTADIAVIKDRLKMGPT